MLKPHAFRRSVELPNTQRAVDLIWEAPSDHRPQHGAQAWAQIRVAWSPQLRQMVPSISRLYTRKTGEQREVMSTSVMLTRLALPASGPADSHAETEVQANVMAALPALVASDPVIARIAADVLNSDVKEN